MKKQLILLFLSFATPCFLGAQESDVNYESAIPTDSVVSKKTVNYPIKSSYLKKSIIPVLLITYGILSIENPEVKEVNISWRNRVMAMKMQRTEVDDYTQFAPVGFVYALNFSGVKGKNSIGDITLISASSFLISTAIVRPLKSLTTVKRPDGSNNHSFPSGHTSTAFVSAQFMYREYRDKDFWLSLVGYPFAVYTALARTVNDKHWFGDIVAGAGIGIVSTELAYYLLPHIKNLFKSFANGNNMVYPVYQSNTYGLALNIRL